MTDTWLSMLEPLRASERPAVVHESGTWNGVELMRRAAGGADFLDAIGAPTGRPVVALLTSSPSAFALAIGAAATDRALAPLGPRLTVAELEPVVARLDSDVIVTEADYAPLATAVATSCGRRVAVLPDLEGSDRRLSLECPPDRAGAILHTSGTTGVPKAVIYHQAGLAARTVVNAELVDLGPGAVYASASGFHHIAGVGMLFVALGAGAALLSMPSFTVDAWRALAPLGVTHALIVPTMIEMLLREHALALPGLRVLQYGASPIHPDTLARAIDALPGVRFVNIFGQTEGSPITCLTMQDHERAAAGRPDLLRSVGRAAPGVEVRIEAPDEHGIGEVVARARHLFAPDADGWLRTGDLGRLDADGYLFLSGRKGDMIIRGGENVYPLEVENVLASHPDVAAVSVYGLPDSRVGEIVMASIVAAHPSAPPDPDDLRAYARERLAGFKVPTRWEFVDELPLNVNGKVLRHELIARHVVEAAQPGEVV